MTINVYIRGHNWVHFTHRLVYCYHEFKLRYLKNQKLFSTTVKALFEPTVLRKKRRRIFALFKSIFLRNRSLSNARWFYGKKRKIGKGNLYLRGYCTPNQKWACFVLYLKIINTFFEKKNIHWNSVGQAVFKLHELWIKTVKIVFGSITQELLSLPKFWCHFWAPWTIYYKMHRPILFFTKALVILR